MPKWGYSFKETNPEIMVKASGRDMRISPKAAREICGAICTMNFEKARRFLQDVIDKKRAVPYRRYNKKVSHKTGLMGWYAGKFPVKAASEIMKILNGLEANAEDKGLYVENMQIIHAASQRGRILKRYMPRAFGRSSPDFNQLCHVELIAKEIK